MATLGQLKTKYFALLPEQNLPARWQPFSPHDGEVPRLVLDGTEWFKELSTEINATTSGDCIWIAGWIFEHNFSTLSERLTEKAEAGVDVRIILWCNPWSDAEDPFLSRPMAAVVLTNIAAAVFLRNHKVGSPATPALAQRVLLDSIGPMMSSMHQKTTVTVRGGKVTGWVSGMDYAGSSVGTTGHLGTGPADRHDTGVILGGDAALDVWDNFAQRWTEAVAHPAMTAEADSAMLDHFQELNPMLTKGDTIALIPAQPPALPARPNTGMPVQTSTTASTQVLRTVPTHHVVLTDPLGWVDEHRPYKSYPPEGLREVFTVYEKAILNAQRYIYIEDQYIGQRTGGAGADKLFDLLGKALDVQDELVVLLVGNSLDGDVDDDGDFASMLDPAGFNPPWIDRVRAFARPSKLFGSGSGSVSGSGSTDEHDNLANAVNLHSKVLVVDDELLVVGSANFMHRSMAESLLGAGSMDCELSVALVSTADEVRDARVALWADMALGKALADLSAAERAALENLDTAIPALFEMPGPASSTLTPVAGWTRIKDRS